MGKRLNIKAIAKYAEENKHLSMRTIAKHFGCSVQAIGSGMRREGLRPRTYRIRRPIRLDQSTEPFESYRGPNVSLRAIAEAEGHRRETIRRRIMQATAMYWRTQPYMWTVMPRFPHEVKLYHAIFEDGVSMTIPALMAATGVTIIQVRAYLDYCKAFSQYFKQLCDSGVDRHLAIEQTHTRFSPGVRNY